MAVTLRAAPSLCVVVPVVNNSLRIRLVAHQIRVGISGVVVMHPERFKEQSDPSPSPAELYVCAPPYQVLSQVPLVGETGIELPWGSVICATGPSVLAKLELLVLAVERWPWIAPALTLPVSERETEVRAPIAEDLAERLAILYTVGDAPSPIKPRPVISAVTLREPPTSRTLAVWASRRLNAGDLREPLEEQFAYALGERSSLSRSRSTYSRRFARGSDLSARDWGALARLVWALCAAVRKKQGHPPAASAKPIAVSQRSLRRYVRKYLDMTWGTATGIVGWEWVMESALIHRGQSS